MKRARTYTFIMASAVLLLVPFLSFGYSGFGLRTANPRPDNPRTESIIIHTLEAGKSITDGVLVVNNDPEPKEMLVFAVDQEQASSGFACKQLSSQKTAVGSWITWNIDEFPVEATYEPGIDAVRITVPERKNFELPFTISVPQNASVGEINGCIFAQEAKAGTEALSSGVQISLRSGLRVALTVDGDIIKDLMVNSVSFSGSDIISVDVTNEGNVSLDTTVDVQATTIFGNEIARIIKDNNVVLRGETKTITAELPDLMWGALGTADVRVSYDGQLGGELGTIRDQEIVTKQGKSVLLIIPPRPLAAVVYVFALAIIIVLLVRSRRSGRKKKRIQETWVTYTVGSGDTLNSVAEQYNISWTELAQANTIKPPYQLSVGDILKVPPHRTGGSVISHDARQ